MITVDWFNKIVHVPQAYLTYLGPNLYELDVPQFRLDLKELEEFGMPYDDIHSHVTELLLSGTIYVRSVSIINGYEVEFENGMYAVKCVGANHNIGDVKVINSVSLIINNSAGSTVTYAGASTISPSDLNAIDAKVDPDGKLKRRLILQKGEDFDVEVETP